MVNYAGIRTNDDVLELRDKNQTVWRGLDGIVKGDNSAHKARHQSGGGDAIKLDDLSAPDDNTDLDATSSKHGLMPKLDKIAFANGWIPAGETWTYAASDAPTYSLIISGDKTSKYSAGMRIKLADSGTKYFIITKVAYGAPNTTLTLYGGTDYALTGGAITNPYYAMVKAPQGFPLQPSKWSVILASTSTRTTNTPNQNQWYNAEAINIPLGIWKVKVQCAIAGYDTSATSVDAEVTLSTSNNSESDANWTMIRTMEGASGTLQLKVNCYRERELELASKQTYYLNYRTTFSGMADIQVLGGLSTTYIIAESIYL